MKILITILILLGFMSVASADHKCIYMITLCDSTLKNMGHEGESTRYDHDHPLDKHELKRELKEYINRNCRITGGYYPSLCKSESEVKCLQRSIDSYINSLSITCS